MSLFVVQTHKAKLLKKKDFKNEKELQTFVEQNMEELLGIRFVATEFSTSKQHGGRIDTLGLDENNAPVIIEYKRGEKDNIINQGLFYLDRLVDHPGDFQLVVHKQLSNNITVDFGSPRVVLIAQSFSKYDLYAINRMSENIDLRTYSRYENDIFEFTRLASSQSTSTTPKHKQLSKVDYTIYTIEQHLQGKSKHIQELFVRIQEKIFALESHHPIEENSRKQYIAYRTSKNFVELEIQNKHIKVFIDLHMHDLDNPRNLGRDVSTIGHFGTGFVEIVYSSLDDLDDIMKLVEQSYVQSV